ncbi:MAG: hypothetical protein H6Q14_2542 [Bacteroidetes bacterium]|nr:hypothetical protein [Bacteroidota bacterium]
MNSKFIILWIFIVGLIVISCNTHQNKTPEGKVNDSVSVNLPVKTKESENKQKVIHCEPFSMDSIIEGYHILYKSRENGKIVTTYPITDGKGKDTICYACQDVILTVTKDGKDVVLNRKIQRDDFKAFIPKNEISKYCISNFKITDVTTSNIKLSINLCIPETDICFWFDLIVSDNGDLKIKEEVEEESDM